MKIITILSSTPGCGKTTMAVNLASGLARQSYTVLLIGLEDDSLLHQWTEIASTDFLKPEKSCFDVDILFNQFGQLDLGEHPGYDYIIIDAGSPNKTWESVLRNTGLIIGCIEAGTGDVSLLANLDNYILDLTNQDKRIDLVVPYKARTAEWDNNFKQFSELAEYFGESRVADMIPFCEAIHDLPQEKKSVWDLPPQYSNRQRAFKQLLDRLLDNGCAKVNQ